MQRPTRTSPGPKKRLKGKGINKKKPGSPVIKKYLKKFVESKESASVKVPELDIIFYYGSSPDVAEHFSGRQGLPAFYPSPHLISSEEKDLKDIQKCFIKD